jgi:hypothetical protein
MARETKPKHSDESVADTMTDSATEETPTVAPKADAEPEAEPEAAAPAKRGPGRPRKNPLAEVAAPARRGPGRPRKNAGAAGGEIVAPKRGPGRPRKVAMDTNDRLLRIEQRLDTIVAELARLHERVGAIAGGEPAAAAGGDGEAVADA